MANLIFSGKITHIGTPQTGEGKNGEWTKTTVVVEEVGEQYPNSKAFDAFNKQSLVDLLVVNQMVEVFYNSKASESNGRYFTNHSIWKVDIKDGIVSPQTNIGNTSAAPSNKQNTPAPSVDDLPF